LWTPNRILIAGFGGSYGKHGWTVKPHDPVEIAVSYTGTCGLNMNVINGAVAPGAVAAVWGGLLP
jgi:hypothetical protein